VAVVINSYGRSGSTMLVNCVREAASSGLRMLAPLVKKAEEIQAWDLNETTIEKGFVYKTHDYPPEKSPGMHVRVVYVFADPVDVVISLLKRFDESGEPWMRYHYAHMKVEYGNVEKLADEDQLGLEEHFDSWMKVDRLPVAFVNYNQLWEHESDLSGYLGFKLQLPPYVQRKARLSRGAELVERIEATYASLIGKIRKARGFFVNSVR
jgi:hypothetical protein